MTSLGIFRVTPRGAVASGFIVFAAVAMIMIVVFQAPARLATGAYGCAGGKVVDASR